MPSMLVTCPETAHLERIDLDVHPLGILIRSCSAFDRLSATLGVAARPGEAGAFDPRCVDCPRTCAARLDQRLKRTGKLGAVLFARSCLREA